MPLFGLLLEYQKTEAVWPTPKELGLLAAGTILGVLGGFLVGLYFQRSDRHGQRPVWTIRTEVLVGPSAAEAGLSVVFEKRVIPNASRSQIVFWNRGWKEITRNDVGPVDLLAIRARGGAELLRAHVQEQTNANCDFRIPDDESTTSRVVSFEYVGRHDGALLDVVHSGSESSRVELTGNFHPGRLRLVTDRFANPVWRVLFRIRVVLALVLTGVAEWAAVTFGFESWVVSIGLASAGIVAGVLAPVAFFRGMGVPAKLREGLFAV